ncbi:hypothetical protein SporoP8_01875 [Sporosarcina ureae]|uniref:hypothetical protein n=1 Tax=Sporosarcina ureae TaxID=1571 RepID=UPI000A15DF67|nr:hypothetical protein [Sporosarcina ureae]ARJ37740.1 hypothetical protein SporoP8_01875 [Sporosarcina ureae]
MVRTRGNLDNLKEEIVDSLSLQTYVTATPYLIANKVDHIGNSSKHFLEMVELQPNYLGIVLKKELLAKTLLEDRSIFEMHDTMNNNERARHESFYNNIDVLFEKIISIVNEK